MTRADAVGLLRSERPPYACPRSEAIDMAIAALEREARGAIVISDNFPQKVADLRAELTELRAELDRLDYFIRRIEA